MTERHIPLTQRLFMAKAEAAQNPAARPSRAADAPAEVPPLPDSAGASNNEAWCETCKQAVESVNEADDCSDCHEAWNAKQEAYWRPLFEGEKQAGLHGEFTQEGLDMRRREMLAVLEVWGLGAHEWGSMAIAEYTRRTDK